MIRTTTKTVTDLLVEFWTRWAIVRAACELAKKVWSFHYTNAPARGEHKRWDTAPIGEYDPIEDVKRQMGRLRNWQPPPPPPISAELFRKYEDFFRNQDPANVEVRHSIASRACRECKQDTPILLMRDDLCGKCSHEWMLSL